MPRPNEAEYTESRLMREAEPERMPPTGGDSAAECLTPRDWFAGKALGAVIAARVAAGLEDLNQESIAEECYELADAMLVERAKRRSI